MHPAHDDLVLVAVGEGTSRDFQHVAACGRCRDEVDSLAAVKEILADGGPMPVEAPSHVWSAIEAAIREEPAPAEVADIESSPGQRAAQSSSRRSSGLSLLGAAAAGAAVMWVGSAVLSPDDASESRVVASAELAPLEGSLQPAEAEIIERDGQRILRVDARDLPRVPDGYLQVWLLGDGASGMVTIGALSENDEEFALPQGLSTDTFATVDVSVEHYDGNPEHSGESLWRGPISST